MQRVGKWGIRVHTQGWEIKWTKYRVQEINYCSLHTLFCKWLSGEVGWAGGRWINVWFALQYSSKMSTGLIWALIFGNRWTEGRKDGRWMPVYVISFVDWHRQQSWILKIFTTNQYFDSDKQFASCYSKLSYLQAMPCDLGIICMSSQALAFSPFCRSLITLRHNSSCQVTVATWTLTGSPALPFMAWNTNQQANNYAIARASS